MSRASCPPLVSPKELAQRLGDPKLAVVDATWTFSGGPAPQAEGSVPGAVFFDIDTISTQNTTLPHMLPPIAAFRAAAERLGLSHDDWIVVYDRIGLFSSPRAWWTLRRMGAHRVSVLNGGLPAWIRDGHAVDPAPPNPDPQKTGQFTALPRDDLYRSFEQVLSMTTDAQFNLVDARPAGRFAGDAPEPRPHLAAGHIPGSQNLPWSKLLDASGHMLPPATLRQVFQAQQVPMTEPMVATCGSGVTACIVALAAACLGMDSVAVYDGSWAEWGSREGAPISTGTPPDR